MKPALAFRQPQYPKNWQALPNGELILNEINQLLYPWWQKFFGYHFLKIGALSHAIDTANSPIKHQMSIARHLDTEQKIEIQQKNNSKHIIADIDDLPLLEHSVDVCLLSHALEFSLDPHHVVREASRVLIPNGYLVITGFNPYSLAGMNKFIPYRNKNSPWNEHFFSAGRVKDWLHLMGYEILADERCLHSSLAGKVNTKGIFNVLGRFSTHYLSCFGSIYVVVAKKRVFPLTPIKPKWQVRTSFQPVKVSTMKVHSSKRFENKS